jgi:cytochrome P450
LLPFPAATANTLSFCLASLAYHPEMQAKARDEVQRVLASGGGGGGGGGPPQFTYEMLKQLPYVWQVFRETLRLFPTVPVGNRSAVQ